MTIDDGAIERLVAAAQQGDPEAFGALFDHYYGPVYRFVAARVGRPSDAEDLAQLVFVKALEALPRYESRGIPFGGWLFRLARNVVIDHIRTRRDHATLDLVVERADQDDGPDELAVLRQEMDSVALALRRLTPGAARGHRAAVLRGALREGGGRGHGPPGRDRARSPVPGHRGAPAGAGDRGPGERTAAGCRNDPMNEDEMAIAEPLAGEELERTLGRYARVRLDPSQAQQRRARSAVMEEAWRRRIDPTGSVAAAAGYRPVRRALFAGWTTRRIAASLSAAMLAGLMVGSSVFAASRAGGPLYESRLALEALTLPSDPSARVDAELAQAQARLAEAVEATGRGDDRAAIAALDAYDAAIDRLTTAGGTSAARAREAVQFHRSVLLEVAANAPAGAAGGLERALENSNRVIESLGERRRGRERERATQPGAGTTGRTRAPQPGPEPDGQDPARRRTRLPDDRQARQDAGPGCNRQARQDAGPRQAGRHAGSRPEARAERRATLASR